MHRIARFWTDMLKAGALALVLVLFSGAGAGAATGAEGHGDLAASASQMLLAAKTDCHGHKVTQDSTGASAAQHGHDHADDHRHSNGDVDDCCKDGCACACAATCSAHAMSGLIFVAVLTPPMPTGLLLPGLVIDPVGLTTPPEPRPPLSI